MKVDSHNHNHSHKHMDRFNAVVVAIVGAAAIVWVYSFTSYLLFGCH